MGRKVVSLWTEEKHCSLSSLSLPPFFHFLSSLSHFLSPSLPPFVLSLSLYLFLLSPRTPHPPAKKELLAFICNVWDKDGWFWILCPLLSDLLSCFGFIIAFFNPTLLRGIMVKSTSSGDWLQGLESQFHHPWALQLCPYYLASLGLICLLYKMRQIMVPAYGIAVKTE